MLVLLDSRFAALSFICVCFPLAAPSKIAPHIDIRSLLTSPRNNWSANTTISFPTSPQFENATERWTLFDAPTYSAAVSPGSEADLVTAVCQPTREERFVYIGKLMISDFWCFVQVKLAVANGVPFLATGGRHGYTTTLGRLQNGVAIDLSQFDTVEVNASARTVTVGGAVQIGELLDPLYDAGFWMRKCTSQKPQFFGKMNAIVL